MRIISLTLILFFICSSILQAQVKAKIKAEKPYLITTFYPMGEDFLEAISNYEFSFSTTFESKGLLAIRICSKDPMPVALATASGRPFWVTSMLEKKGFSKARMIYLRQDKNCKLENDQEALTEFWSVPRDTELPEFAESRKAQDLSVYELAQSEELTPALYKSALDKLIDVLRKDRRATAIVHIPYYPKSVSLEMNKRISFTLKYLSDNGIGGYRIYVRKFSLGARPDATFEDPIYPDISVISENE